MIHRLLKLAAAGTFNMTHTSGKLSHLLFGQNVAFSGTTDFLTVTLKSPLHDPIVIVNRVPMLALAAISDQEMGASQTLQVALNAATGVTDYVGFFCAVHLGNIDLKNTSSTLEITWETAATVGGCSAVNAEPSGPDYLLKTYISSQLSDRAVDVDRLFIYYGAGSDVPYTDAALDDVFITLEGPNGATACSLQDAIAFTAVFGEVEATAPRTVFCFYRDEDDIPDNVSFQVSGSDADSDIQIITRTKVHKQDRLLASSGAMLDKAATRLEKFSAGKIRALQMAGVAAGHPAELRKGAANIKGVKPKMLGGMA